MKGRIKMSYGNDGRNAVIVFLFILLVIVIGNIISKIDILSIIYLIVLVVLGIKFLIVIKE